MNLYNDVPGRMEYIQRLFLEVESRIAAITDVQQIIEHLDTEPPEFRSIAYESASFEIAFRDLKREQGLQHWIELREACATQHTFHIDIGLGWAFAKSELWPHSILSPMQQSVKWMVFDGLGYYYALFRGRNTLKAKEIPPEITGENLNGFDQGIGRRLWYMAKGNIIDINTLVAAFPAERHSDLFCGIGIACGYVGGSREEELRQLFQISGPFYKQLQIGTMLAAISRIASNTVNKDIERACHVVCNKNLNEIRTIVDNVPGNFFYLYKTGIEDFWLAHFESALLQTR